MLDVLGGEREVVLAVTHQTSNNSRYALAELITWIAEDDNRKKGEMVLLVHGYRDAGEQQLPDEALRTLTI